MSNRRPNPTRVPLDGFIHKLNNPLGALLLWAQELAKPLEDERRQEIADCLLREVRSLSKLLKRVAAVDGATQARWGRVRMDAVLRQAVASAVVDLPGAAIPVVIVPELPVFMDGDATMLAQLVEQLVRNAMESGSDRVWVKLEQEDDRLRVEVLDEGSGLDAEDEDDVWRPFFSTKPGHAGIGLSLAARATQVHGGTLELKPRTPLGAKVLINLPIVRTGGE